MNGFKAFEMMKEGKIVCVTNCENVGYKFKNGFIVEQNLVIDDEPIRHDVIKYHKEIDCKEDIENLEKLINEKWYEEDRYIAIINFKKLA